MKDNVLIEAGKPFQVPKHSFWLSESVSGYTLQCSVDCKGEDDADAHWADFSSAIPANKQHCIPGGIAAGMWWRCYGNTGTMFVRF